MKNAPTKMVRYTLTPGQPLTAEQRERLDRLEAMPDEEIDYSDIPPMTEADFAHAVRPRQVRGDVERYVPMCLDPDLAAWFKAHAKTEAWQAEINQILRQHMTQAEARQPKKAS